MTDHAATLLTDRQAFNVGSLDYQWRTRAAWKIDQMRRGIPVNDWTDEPPVGADMDAKNDN